MAAVVDSSASGAGSSSTGLALSEEAQTGLRALATAVDTRGVTSLCKIAGLTLAGRNKDVDAGAALADAIPDVPLATLKLAYAAVCTTFLEGVKVGATTETVRATAAEAGASDAVAAAIAATYGQCSPALVAVLEETTIVLPQITDVEWRLDYQLRSGNAGREHQPSYTLDLKTLGADGQITHNVFTCTVAQLTDLLARVQDATSAVERLIAAGATQSGRQ